MEELNKIQHSIKEEKMSKSKKVDNDGDKKIVFFDGNLKQGGAERVISLLANKLAKDGKKVCVLLYQDEELFYEIDEKVSVISVEKETGSNNIVKNIKWIHRFFSNDVQVVISFLASINMVALIAHIGIKCPIIVADRNDPRYVPSNVLIRKSRDILYRFADGVVLQTTQNKKYFSKIVQSKSVVIPNPIDLGEKQGIALKVKKEKEIVSVGRLMPQKNQMMLIDAFGMIADKFPEYYLTIYGEGPERERLKKRTLELQICNRVNLPGSIKNVYDMIAKAEIFVLSSNYEGMPNALIEATCVGLPCISTSISGSEDVIQSGCSGDITPVGDTKALANALNDLLLDQDRRYSYSLNAVKNNERFNIDIIIRQWLGFIDTIRQKG